MPAEAKVKQEKKARNTETRRPKTKGKNSRGWVGVCPSLTGSNMVIPSRAFLKLNFCHQIRGWGQICAAAATHSASRMQSQS